MWCVATGGSPTVCHHWRVSHPLCLLTAHKVASYGDHCAASIFLTHISSSSIIFTMTRKKQNRNPSTIIPVTPFGVLPVQPQQPQLKGFIQVFFIFGLFWFLVPSPGDNRWTLGQKSIPNESLPLYCVMSDTVINRELNVKYILNDC